MTHCSWKKKPVQEGSPEELYGSPRISNFIAYCKRNTLAWAILSAKHSLFFPDEKKPNYNATFKSDPSTKQCRVLENNRLLDETASRAWLNQLVLDVRQKILSRNVRSIMFWPGEPRDGVDPLMRVKCYLKFLHAGADECAVDHGSWREIVQHIDALSRSGDGRIEFVERLPQ